MPSEPHMNKWIPNHLMTIKHMDALSELTPRWFTTVHTYQGSCYEISSKLTIKITQLYFVPPFREYQVTHICFAQSHSYMLHCPLREYITFRIGKKRHVHSIKFAIQIGTQKFFLYFSSVEVWTVLLSSILGSNSQFTSQSLWKYRHN